MSAMEYKTCHLLGDVRVLRGVGEERESAGLEHGAVGQVEEVGESELLHVHRETPLVTNVRISRLTSPARYFCLLRMAS